MHTVRTHMHTMRKRLNGYTVTLVVEFLMTSGMFFALHFPVKCITCVAKSNKSSVHCLTITLLCSLSQDVAFCFLL